MAVRFWQWFGGCVVFALVPFALEYLVARSYGRPVGIVDVFGNADLCLAASLLSCAGTLNLYLSVRSSPTEGVGLFLMTLTVAVFSLGYYAAVTRTFPDNAGADAFSVACVSGMIYLAAIIFSWFGRRVAEQGRAYGPR